MITIEDVQFNYRRKPSLFDGLALKIPAGNIYGLLGKNGAGKTTLLKMISGLLFPQKGRVDVLGHTPEHRSPEFLKEIFLINEEFILPEMTIKRYVDLFSPFYPGFDHEAFRNYLAEFDLPKNQRITSLSYGLKKKFLLAFGLATECSILILDEPTNGLDIPSKSQFRKIVANAIHPERTILISTHQVRDVEHLIDPIIILDEGQILFYEDFERVTSKLTLAREASLADTDGLVYAEPFLGGYTIVRENRESVESKMNLEILFNAVTNSREKIHEIFNKS